MGLGRSLDRKLPRSLRCGSTESRPQRVVAEQTSGCGHEGVHVPGRDHEPVAAVAHHIGDGPHIGGYHRLAERHGLPDYRRHAFRTGLRGEQKHVERLCELGESVRGIANNQALVEAKPELFRLLPEGLRVLGPIAVVGTQDEEPEIRSLLPKSCCDAKKGLVSFHRVQVAGRADYLGVLGDTELPARRSAHRWIRLEERSIYRRKKETTRPSSDGTPGWTAATRDPVTMIESA